MKKIIKSEVEMYCDVTGQKINTINGQESPSTLELIFNVLFHDEIRLAKEDGDNYFSDCIGENDYNFDIGPDVASEIFIFLCNKYPKFKKRYCADDISYGSKKELQQKLKSMISKKKRRGKR